MPKKRSPSSGQVAVSSPFAASGTDQTDNPAERPDHLIVGIGASAGGLDAFKSFLSKMPADSGMAFVLIQHLDPDYESSLAEIIGECTEMPVVKAADRTEAAPNTVIVTPQNAILTIEGGVLRVASPATPTARRSSIDAFLVSLAEDQGENAVGIILSGFGNDGTAGIEAIKESGGLTLSEAAFDHRAKFGMPRSATDSGFVDYVLQPQEMPARLLAYRDFKTRQALDGTLESLPDQANYLAIICSVLKSRLGRDFGQYKSSTLMRRIRRRMQVLHIEEISGYILKLRKLPNEPELLFREILIGVTRFFRDPTMFDALAQTVLPELITKADPDVPIRVWVAGCATGEEAYSLAILFREMLTQAESTQQITIFASDLDDRAITVARAGLYSDAIEADVSADRLARYFVVEGSRYRVAKHIRDMCVFSTHDLVKDPPFSKLDLVSCRNLLIYFALPLQKRVISTFHYGLKTNGFLWLGPSETIASSARLFKSIDKRCRIFRRLDVAVEIPRARSSSRMIDAPTTQTNAEADSIDALATRMIAQYAPAYIVVDSQHEIQRFSGPVAKFMEPMSGGASLNLFRMLHTQLRPPVRSLVRKALNEQQPIEEIVTFQVSGQDYTINLIAESMLEPVDGQRCILLVFQELKPGIHANLLAMPDDDAFLVDPVNTELIAAREKLQTITEELETANEELQSSNEEFQSVNEELHSTVEELETSKEELQSINEELQTVNAELNNRADSLVRSNSDLANLFDSTSIATLFLDNGSHIRRFTPAITDIFNVRDGDEGRPISDFSSRLAGSALTEDIKTVLRDLGSLEREADSKDGAATYLVRVKPYRDLNNVIDGVVITLIDISERKKLERDQAHLAAIVTSSEDAIISHDLEGTITSWNAGAEKIYGYIAEEMIGQAMATLLDGTQVDEWPDNLVRLREGEPVTNIDISRVTKGDRVIYVSLTISPMRDAQGTVIGASAVARDISSRKLIEERNDMLMAELDHRVKNILAVVSSVVNQSLKSSGSAQTIRTEVEGRIQAIAHAHNLLTEFGSVEGSLGDLVATELKPFGERATYTRTGDDVVLTSRANLSIALAIHELVTNSAKYGALSTDQGHLDLTWQITGTKNLPKLEVIWQESGGPPVAPPARRGFGTRLIEQSLVRGLNAKVKRDFLETGVICHISMPLSSDIGRIRAARLPDTASK